MPLISHDLRGIASFILSPECRSICVLTGAGVSCAAGIPDFRSPGGMYLTLRPELITATAAQRAAMAADPVSVVERSMFLSNPFPYLEVRRPFIVGTQEKRWHATISHRFVELLHTKAGKLTRLYTQNIDGLDFQTRLPPELIVPVHGSMGSVACEVRTLRLPVEQPLGFCSQPSSRPRSFPPSRAAPRLRWTASAPACDPTSRTSTRSIQKRLHSRRRSRVLLVAGPGPHQQRAAAGPLNYHFQRSSLSAGRSVLLSHFRSCAAGAQADRQTDYRSVRVEPAQALL
jgi:hypothetical protein